MASVITRTPAAGARLVSAAAAGLARAHGPGLGGATTCAARSRAAAGFVAARCFSAPAVGKRGPHGGKLVELMVTDAEQKKALLGKCNVPALELSERQACDVELLGSGAFSPLEGFMTEVVWKSVLDNMRLPGSNLLFGLPVVLDTDRADMKEGKTVSLNFQGQPLATMTIESVWKPDKAYECKKSYGHTTLEHPGCRMIAMERKHTYIGGKLSVLATPKRIYPVETPKNSLRTTI